MTDITNIPLNRLTEWEGNVRRTQNRGFIDELAASIKAHGLQQNLIVQKQGRKFAVIAGGQRLKALNLLAREGAIRIDHPVACRIAEGVTDATELSLAENVVRDAMHPADQFEAFRVLIDKGAPVEDIAARFGITPAVVTQRLKLGRVSPLILKAYRTEELTLEDVMAFAVSDDHAAQERVFAGMVNWHGAREIRAALTEGDIAASDRRVRFVTFKAYERNGGATRRDLFTKGDDGIFITDAALLEKLVIAKLERAAKPVRSEGWKWVETRPSFGYEDRAAFRCGQPALQPLSAEDAARLETLQRQYDAMLEQGAEDSLDELEQEIERLNERDEFWPPETLAIAGAVVTIGYDGDVSVERGLIRPEDVPKPSSGSKARRDASDPATGADATPGYSAALVESLTAERSAALSAELLQRPDVALATIVHALASRVILGSDAGVSSLEIAASPQSLRRVEGSKAFIHVEAARESWRERLPGSVDALWTWCHQQDQGVLLDLLAFCCATTVNAVQVKSEGQARSAHAAMLASALSLDMNAWFAPTAANYFSRVSKAQILDALREAKNTPPAPAWEKLAKSALALLAERETSGTGWLPPLLR